MSSQRKHTNQVAVLNVAEEHIRELWPAAMTVGMFFSPRGTYGFGYYYFMEVWPALLPAGSG